MSISPPPGWYPSPTNPAVAQWWDGQRWSIVATRPPAPPKSVGITYLFLLLLGGFGAHRFYLGMPVSAVIFMLTWWTGWMLVPFGAGWGSIIVFAMFVWYVIDLCIAPTMTRAANIRILATQNARYP